MNLNDGASKVVIVKQLQYSNINYFFQRLSFILNCVECRDVRGHRQQKVLKIAGKQHKMLWRHGFE